MVHVPSAARVTVEPLVPEVVQTKEVSEEKVTALPEPPPVAETVKGASPRFLLPSGPKVIAWPAMLTVKLRVTCGAAL